MPTKKKTPAARKPASVQDYKKKHALVAQLELPTTGFLIEAKRISKMRVFLKSGLVPNSLLSTIQEAIDTGQEPKMDDILAPNEAGEVDSKQIEDMLTLIDNVTVECWIHPPTAHPPEDDSERRDDVLYTDQIDDEDKLFVFQWATGGTPDLVEFRKQFDDGVDTLRGSSTVEGPTK